MTAIGHLVPALVVVGVAPAKRTCRFRSGSASWNCPSSATNQGWQNLPQDLRPWIPRRLPLRFVHMRRSRTAPAPLQVRLVRASWPCLSDDDKHAAREGNAAGKAGFRRSFQGDRAAKLGGFRKKSARQQSVSIACIAKRRCMSECAGRRGVIAFDRAGRDLFQRFVVPHLCFSKQSPALQGTKHRALTAQRLHCAVANEVFHFSPPTCLPKFI